MWHGEHEGGSLCSVCHGEGPKPRTSVLQQLETACSGCEVSGRQEGCVPLPQGQWQVIGCSGQVPQQDPSSMWHQCWIPSLHIYQLRDDSLNPTGTMENNQGIDRSLHRCFLIKQCYCSKGNVVCGLCSRPLLSCCIDMSYVLHSEPIST